MARVKQAQPGKRFSATNHPLARNANTEHAESMTPIERTCKQVADKTGSPWALILAALLQVIWIAVGILTHWDPFPFVFLLTCSNVIQLILIFVLAVGQRQSSSHAELRAEHDHDAISRLLHHSDLQEEMLLKVFAALGVDGSVAVAKIAELSAVPGEGERA